MTSHDNRIKELTDTAISIEEKGIAFYEKAIETCSNDIGKEVFIKLKNAEFKHIDRFKQIYETVSKGAPLNEITALHAETKVNIKKMFKKLALKHGPKISTESSDIEALDVGIGLENESIKYYEQQMEGATDQQEKVLLEQIIAEERDHHAVLADMKHYYTDPESWFQENEHIGLDGA